MATKQTKAQDGRRELADLLAAVMAHPETPTTLYNAIARELTGMSSSLDYHTPDTIERVLEASQERESRRKGGTR